MDSNCLPRAEALPRDMGCPGCPDPAPCVPENAWGCSSVKCVVSRPRLVDVPLPSAIPSPNCLTPAVAGLSRVQLAVRRAVCCSQAVRHQAFQCAVHTAQRDHGHLPPDDSGWAGSRAFLGQCEGARRGWWWAELKAFPSPTGIAQGWWAMGVARVPH